MDPNFLGKHSFFFPTYKIIWSISEFVNFFFNFFTMVILDLRILIDLQFNRSKYICGIIIIIIIIIIIFRNSRSFIYLFIYLWLCWVFVSLRGLFLIVASGDHSSSQCAGLSPSRPLLLRSTGSRRAGSVVVAHGPSCSVACGIFPDEGSNPCPLHWQADSQPLRHQGSPIFFIEGWRNFLGKA